MKHMFHKGLCLVLALLMTISMLPATLFASAAETVVLQGDQVLVDDDFADQPTDTTVSTVIGGVTYEAVMGTNAFATIPEAAKKVANGGAIYVGPGKYVGDVTFSANIELYGAGMNVNPNNSDWTVNPKRSDLSKESILENTLVSINATGLTKFVVNGFTMTGTTSIQEMTANGTIKGIDISYNLMRDHGIAGSSAFYFTGTTVRSGRLSYNHIETTSDRAVTFRNGDNFTFQGNYFKTQKLGLYLLAEVQNASKVPGKMKIDFVDNYGESATNAVIQCELAYADTVQFNLRNNYMKGVYGLSMGGNTGSTPNKIINIEGNTMIGSSYDVLIYANVAPCTFDPAVFKVKNNTFVNGSFRNDWATTSGLMDLTYNYFKDSSKIRVNPAPVVYPRYSDADLTTVVGAMDLQEVSLTGVKTNGDREPISGIVIDNTNATISSKEIVDAIYNTIEISAIVKPSDASVSVGYYSDPACTKELTDGNVIDYLKKGSNLAYVKLTTSLDNYSYKVYTVEINRSASRDANILGIKEYDHTIGEDRVEITVPSYELDPYIGIETASGAISQIFLDEALTKPVYGYVLKDLPAGSSTYYVKITAEDGVTVKKYAMVVTRAPQVATDIIKFNTPDLVTYNEDLNAYLGVYSSRYESVDVDVEVSDLATWKLFADEDCTQEVNPKGIALNTGDNVYYIQVSSEAGASVNVYKVIFRKESAAASKEIYSVISDAVASSVTADSVSIKLADSVKTYAPQFDYAGKFFKIYRYYEDGALYDVVANNTFVDIAAGEQTYYIEVTAQDGSTKVYTLYLDRQFSTGSKLIAIGGGNSSYVDRFDFIATTEVQNEGAFYPTFEVSDNATVTVSKKNDGGEYILPINLRPGVSEFVITVTAEDGIHSTQYQWFVTCIGDGIAILNEGVAYDPIWDGLEMGEVVYATINGEIKKAYYGETAFASLIDAQYAAAASTGIVYVMPGVMIEENISLIGVKLYGANFAVDPNTGNRFYESVLTGTVSMSGANAAVVGFTLTDTAKINNNALNGSTISHNIFSDGVERTETPINLSNTKTGYSNVIIQNNWFDLGTEKVAISISLVLDNAMITDNTFNNCESAAAVKVDMINEGATVDFSNNTVEMDNIALDLTTDAAYAGYLNMHDNTFICERAISMDASKATNSFVFNFNNNKVETTKLAVDIANAPASFATNFTANLNSFDSIDHSFSLEYADTVNVAALEPVDITKNYYGTATPGNNNFDSSMDYKPYYLDADKKYLSNAINSVIITAAGNEAVEDGVTNYVVVPGDNATVKVTFRKNGTIPVDGYGAAYVSESMGAFLVDEIDVGVNGATKVYVKVVSADETASEVKEVMVYSQTGNPVYDVYDVVDHLIEDMNVRVVVDHRATTWTPDLAIVNELDIQIYSDAACTKKIDGSVQLTGDSTTVYGKVAGYETVTFTVYKKLSSEKAILSIEDAYTFAYVDANTANVQVDDRLTVADLTAVCSEGAYAYAYADADLTQPVDESAITNGTDKLYYEVIAADETRVTYEVNIDWITVVDPDLLSVKNTNTVSFDGNVLVAQVNAYDSAVGFSIKLNTNAGCTYKLYTNADHEMIFKNSTAFFASNYVYVYAVVTSPDGVVSKEYTIILTKATAKVDFVDAIPAWAKTAVEFTKDLGIVNGEKVNGGYKLNANGTTTREMMACFIVRMLGVDVSQYSYVDLTTKFADADQVSDWALSSMKAAVELGIFAGSQEGNELKLNAKKNISRQEFAVVFVRAIGKEDVDVKAYSFKYSDAANIAEWARTAVKIISKLGYMQGSGGKFNPTASITRAEIIQTIYNYMK